MLVLLHGGWLISVRVKMFRRVNLSLRQPLQAGLAYLFTAVSSLRFNWDLLDGFDCEVRLMWTPVCFDALFFFESVFLLYEELTFDLKSKVEKMLQMNVSKILQDFESITYFLFFNTELPWIETRLNFVKYWYCAIIWKKWALSYFWLTCFSFLCHQRCKEAFLFFVHGDQKYFVHDQNQKYTATHPKV